MNPRTITVDFTGAHIQLEHGWEFNGGWHEIVRRAVKWDAILILQNFIL